MLNNIYYNKNNVNKKRLNIKNIVTAVVVIVVLSTVTIFGYTKNKLEDYSSIIYNLSLSEVAKNIDISSTDKNITMTAESVFGDNENIYVLFSLTNKNGKPLKYKYSYNNDTQKEEILLSYSSLDIDFDKNSNYSGSYELFPIKDKNNENCYIVLHIETQRKKDEIQNIGQNLNVSISGLHFGKFTDILGLSPENSGNWEFNIPLQYQDYGKDYKLNIPFEHKGNIVYLDYIHYSPLNIGLHLKSDEGNLKDFTYSNFEGTSYIKLETTKGLIYPQSMSGDNNGTYVDIPFNMIDFDILEESDILGVYYCEKDENGNIIYENLMPINILSK